MNQISDKVYNKYLVEGRYQKVILDNNIPKLQLKLQRNKVQCPTGVNSWSIAFLTLHK
jgi:hypothetical protein